MATPKSTPTSAVITTGTTLSIAAPSNITSGDVLVAFIRSQQNGGADMTPPVGWTRVTPPYDDGTSGGRLTAAFIKVAGQSEPSNYDWTLTARAVGCIVAYSGNDVEPTVVGGSNDYRGTWDSEVSGRRSAAFSITQSPAIQFFFAGSELVDGVPHIPATAPNGFSVLSNTQTGGGTAGSRTGIWVGAKEPVSTGESAVLVWDGGPAGEASQSFALKLVPAPSTGAEGVFQDGAGNSVSLQATRSNGTVYTPEVQPMRRGFASVADMLAQPGFTMAHRGGSAYYPEMSLHAYTQSVRLGYGVLEVSFGRTSDGVWVGVHDNNINRVVGTTGLPNINAMTWAEVQEYQNTRGVQGSPQPFMRWEEIRDAYGSTHILVLDPKNYNWGTYQTEFLAMCDELGPTRVIVKQWAPDVALATAAKARGYQCWGHGFEEFVGNADVNSYLAAWTILGLEIYASDEAWAMVRATGKPIVAHVAQTQADFDAAMSKGASGVQCGGVHQIAAVGPYSKYVPPEVEEPVTANTVVAFYNGTQDGADTMFTNALGSATGAGVSYYTVNAKIGGKFVLRSWDIARINAGYVPYIHFQSSTGTLEAGTLVQTHPWADVAAGLHDQDFIDWAEALQDAPVGTSFSFDGEPETRLEQTWVPVSPKNTPAYYAAACRHIYDVMHPIAPHIDYRWWIAGHMLNSYMESFYPGDAYVDSIGIDPYVWSYNPSTTHPKDKYSPIVTWLRSRSWGQGKPIGISETGIDVQQHGDAAGAVFWQRMPQTCIDLDLRWITLYNRGQWTITPQTFPQSWAAYVAAMQQIAS